MDGVDGVDDVGVEIDGVEVDSEEAEARPYVRVLAREWPDGTQEFVEYQLTAEDWRKVWADPERREGIELATMWWERPGVNVYTLSAGDASRKA